MGHQMVVVPGYGCYAASPQPTPEGMHALGYPNVSMQWSHSPQHPFGGYMPQVQGEQRSDQARQPGFQPPGNLGQQVQPQQQDNVVFMQPSLPPVPPFPVQSHQPQQNQQSVHQMQLMPNQVNQQSAQVLSHLQGQRPGPPPATNPQLPHGANAAIQQHQTPHYANAPPQPPQQHQPPGNLQPHVSSSQTTPSLSDDSPQSYEFESPQANGNWLTNGTSKADRNSKRRAKKQEGSSLMRTVEKLLEASDPPILAVDDLHKRIEAQGPQAESPATVPRLLQHLKALPERFLVDGQHVTLVRFAHRDEVQHILKATPAKAT